MNNWYNLSAPNMGLLFYKQLYKDVGAKLLKINEKGALAFGVNDKKSEFLSFYNAMYEKRIDTYHIPQPITIGTHQFTLYTTYPGLLIGSGYAHSTKTTGDANIGFYFDHTTGLPTIPGSSVKGVMRSVFELDEDRDGSFYAGNKSLDAILFLINEINNHHISIETKNQIAVLRNSLEANKAATDYSYIKALVVEIFGETEEGGVDTFFDAVVNIEDTKNSTTNFLGSDYITPHKNPLKNPTPIQFLKVLPNVGFTFRFQLNDSTGMSRNLKEALFRQILLTLGIGAKTNVGYGQLKTATSLNTKQGEKQLQSEHPQEQKETPKTAISMKAMEKFKAGLHKAVLVAEEDGYYILKLYDCTLVKSINGFEKKAKEMAEKRAKRGKSEEYKAFVVGGEIMVDIKENFRYNSENHYPFSLVPDWK